MAVLQAHLQFARSIETIEVAREAQAAWGQMQSEVDTLVLSPESHDELVDLIENPQPATAAIPPMTLFRLLRLLRMMRLVH